MIKLVAKLIMCAVSIVLCCMLLLVVVDIASYLYDGHMAIYPKWYGVLVTFFCVLGIRTTWLAIRKKWTW